MKDKEEFDFEAAEEEQQRLTFNMLTEVVALLAQTATMLGQTQTDTLGIAVRLLSDVVKDTREEGCDHIEIRRAPQLPGEKPSFNLKIVMRAPAPEVSPPVQKPAKVWKLWRFRLVWK